MNKTYIRPTMSVEQCETKTAFSLTFSGKETQDAWTKEETGNEGSFDTSGIWDTEW